MKAAVWNGTAPRRWSWFVTYLRRRLGWCEFVGVWEDQERGVLHRHFLIRLDKPTTDKRVSAAVRNSARRWGFGTRFDVQGVRDDAGQAAWYVASYATKTVDRMGDRPMLDVRTGEMRRPGRGFRPWSCSRKWGDSVREVKERQTAWARVRAGVVASATQPHGPGAEGALDLNSEISTVRESEMVSLLRAEFDAVLL